MASSTSTSLRSAERMLAQFSGFTSSLLSKPSLNEILSEVLDASIDLLDADFGNIQLLDPSRHVLTIVASRGFDDDFLRFFAEVSDDIGASGRALKHADRVIVPDVDLDPDYEPLLMLARSAGYRGLQSTPMYARDGRVLGMISTHFREPYNPDGFALRMLDLYARQAADLIEREQQRLALQDAVERLEHKSAELRAANEIKDHFMGLISHELRTPLAIILGDARLLKKRRPELDPEDVDTLLSDVADEALRLNDMIGHLIGIAKSDFSVIDTEPLLLSRTVEAVLDDFRAKKADREIELLMDDNLPLVTGDEESTRHVLGNLLSNADKFSPPSATILVRARRLGDGVTVSVRDRGPSVASDSLERIFEPFYRSGDPTRSKGLGLGLTLCKRLMEKQGGQIWARRRVGGGLSVTLRLPRLIMSDTAD